MLLRNSLTLTRCLNVRQAAVLSAVKPLHSHAVRCVATSSRLHKGSSHWQNIRHTKAAKDLQRNHTINRLVLQLQKHAKTTDYVLNVDGDLKLRALVDQWHSLNLPKATLERQMDRIRNRSFTEHTMCLVGPSGSFFVVRAMVDNVAAFENGIRRKMNKVGGFRAGGSSILPSFEEKSILSTSADSLHSLEDAEDVAIEIEAEEVHEAAGDDGQRVYEFVGDPLHVSQLHSALAAHGQTVLDASVVYRPLYPVRLSERELQVVNAFYQLLDKVDELDRVFDNIDWPDQ